MTIAEFRIHRYDLPLVRALPRGPEVPGSRRGVIITLADDTGRVAYGDIAPLPGFSREDLTQAAEELRRLRQGVVTCAVPRSLEGLSGGFDQWLGGYSLSPSVRFGFESAVLCLSATVADTALARLICNAPSMVISTQALLSGDHREAVQEARAVCRAGYRALKLKVGQLSAAAAAATVASVRKAVGDGVLLRLDANRAWDLDGAEDFMIRAAHLNVDYLEEPVSSVPVLRQLSRRFDFRPPIPLAIDEGLLEFSPVTLPSLPGVRAVVLKPTILGLERAVRFARRARSLGMIPIISASFESGVGLLHLAHLAAAINEEDVPVGLDTQKWFRHDLLRQPLADKAGRVELSLFDSITSLINTDYLTELTDA